MWLTTEAHVSTEGAAYVLSRPRRGPSNRDTSRRDGEVPTGPRHHHVRKVAPILRFVPLVASLLLLVGTASAEESLRSRFEYGASLKDAGDCAAALPVFEEIAGADGPDGAGDPAADWVREYAHYNAATCHEALGSPQRARGHYDTLISAHPALPEGLLADALYRRALLDVLPGRPSKAARRDLMRVRRLSKSQLAKALVDLQLARLDSVEGRDRAALPRLLRAGVALDAAGDDVEVDRRGAPLDWYRAEASLVRATLWANRALDTRLSLTPLRSVTKRIRTRSDALSSAESHYAVAAGLPFVWAPRALLDLGNAWLATAESLAALKDAAAAHPRPEAAALREWLAPRVPAQFRKAAEAWQLCGESARVLGIGREVASQCQAQLDALVSRPELRPDAP